MVCASPVRKITSMVFDLDGTLVDSAPDIAAALNRLLADHQLPALSVARVEELTGEGALALIEKAYLAFGLSVSPRRAHADMATYLEYYRQAPSARSKLYSGVQEALEVLHAAGLRLGVCTNKPQELAEVVLAHLGLAKLFTSVVGGDAMPERKPHPAPLRRTLREMGAEPGQSLFVGDTLIDLECARNAAVSALIVQWGRGATAVVDPAGVLQSFSDLPALVGLP